MNAPVARSSGALDDELKIIAMSRSLKPLDAGLLRSPLHRRAMFAQLNVGDAEIFAFDGEALRRELLRRELTKGSR